MPFLQMSSAEFVNALKRLSPKRITAAMRSGELYVGMSGGEAVFCIRGALTRCPVIDSDWEGFAAVNFGMAISFVKAPPSGELVSLKWSDGRLRIDTLSLAAKWSGAPEWIAAMATEAHLQAVEDEREIKRFCPRCCKRKGEPVEPTARQWPQGLPVATHLNREHANMLCSGCGHAWCETGAPG